MQRPHLRFTMKGMMIVVAAFAFVLVVALAFVQLNDLAFDYHPWTPDSKTTAGAAYLQGMSHAGESYRAYVRKARAAREEGQVCRRKQVEAQNAVDDKRRLGLPTTQQERREPWYWGMRADEAAWQQRVAEGYAAIFTGKVNYTLENYHPPAPPKPSPPPP